MKRFVLLIAAIVFVTSLLSCVQEPAPTKTRAQIIDNAQKSVVEIDAYGLTGSGVIVNKENDSYDIITNYHVIKNALLSKKNVTIRFYNSESFINAAVLGYIESYDICVLRANSTNDYPAIGLNNDKNIQIGDDVIALGYNGGKIGAYDGMISAIDKHTYAVDIDSYIFMNLTTAPFIDGCSGGLLIDDNGTFNGILAYALISGAYYTGLTYAIPAQIVAAAYLRIINTQSTSSIPSLLSGFVINPDKTIRISTNQHNFTIKEAIDGFIVTQTGQKIKKINGYELNSAAKTTILLSEIMLTFDQAVFSY